MIWTMLSSNLSQLYLSCMQRVRTIFLIIFFFYPISPVFSPWMSHSQSSRQSFQSLRTAAHKSSSPSGWPWSSSLLTTATAPNLLFPLFSSNLSLSPSWPHSNTNGHIFSVFCLLAKVLRYFNFTLMSWSLHHFLSQVKLNVAFYVLHLLSCIHYLWGDDKVCIQAVRKPRSTL